MTAPPTGPGMAGADAALARARVPAVVEAAGRMIRCESPSADLDAVARSADVVADVGTAILAHPPERVVLDGCTHLRWRLGTGPRRVLVLGHHDTVWPLGTLDSIPFQDGDRLRGPGCLDMKVGLSLAFHAVAALKDPDGITILVTGDEELSSRTSRALIESEARGCSAALVLEAGADSGALKTERKGRAHYLLTFLGRAAHAGLEPHLGANALVALGHALGAVSSLADAAAGTSVTPTTATAGTAANTVPERATLTVDVRARTLAELERVDRAIRGDLAHGDVGVVVEVEGGIDRPPLEAGMTADLFARACVVADVLGLPQPVGEAVGGGSDGNLTAAAGIPTLDGLGAVGGGAHAAHEWVDVARLGDQLALLLGLLGDLLGPGRSGP
jgi:glutamate carboxypeptidase